MKSNIPIVKAGLVAVSRDCFPIDLSERRKAAVLSACKEKNMDIIDIKKTVENELDVLEAVKELKDKGCNAVIVYLGNFGPENPETMIAEKFGGPAMFVGAAEETGKDLINGRGDAYCGMLNCSYALGIKSMKGYIPEYPVGTAEEVADMIADFIPVARVLIGLSSLKVITFGPRPQDFLACNAPIKPLFDLGINVMENSELDLFAAYKAHENDKRIDEIAEDMAKELGAGNNYPDILKKLARYEATLLDLVESYKGASEYVTMANKCWPAFTTEFGFEPCYVNSRFTTRLMPIACEVDIYGALSEYIICCATGIPPTLLDINNTVPYDIYNEEIKGKYNYKHTDTFMGFHCGNTPSCHLVDPQLKYQLIMNRNLEGGGEPDITRGTLESDIKPGKITFFRLQSSAGGELRSYIAEGEILPVATRSFGGIGIFAIPEMARFYRHVLIGKNYPHHGSVAFDKIGKTLFSVMKMLGVEDVAFNQPAGMLYKDENPFA